MSAKSRQTRQQRGEPHVFVSADTRKKAPSVKQGKQGNQGKVLNLGHLDSDIVSDLELRISDSASLGTSTIVENPLQISPILQNKPNFRKVKLNVSNVLTRDYERMDTWSIGKNEPKRTQFQKGQNERILLHNKGI